MLAGKRILLMIGGGIAAYKALDLIRRLGERGVTVRCILTAGGAQFITPLSVAALSGEKVYTDLFSLTDEAEMGHIRLSREADLVVVAPATADLLAKMAAGLADDLASTALLATDKRVLVAPSMNAQMWSHPATRRNMAALAHDGVLRVGPGSGDLACGEVGAGRMAEVPEIIAAIESFFNAQRHHGPLAGHRALVTAGPTWEAIDPVRVLTNRSSGKQGYAIASALAALGADVTLVSGPTALPAPEDVGLVRVESARQMLDAARASLPVDIAVCTAAVADWRVDSDPAQKIKKDGGPPPSLKLTENPDILANLSAPGAGRPQLVVGFAAETEKLIDHARAKLQRKGCDWIAANDVSGGAVVGGEYNRLSLVTRAGVEDWPEMTKDETARKLAARIADYFNPAAGTTE